MSEANERSNTPKLLLRVAQIELMERLYFGQLDDPTPGPPVKRKQASICTLLPFEKNFYFPLQSSHQMLSSKSPGQPGKGVSDAFAHWNNSNSNNTHWMWCKCERWWGDQFEPLMKLLLVDYTLFSIVTAASDTLGAIKRCCCWCLCPRVQSASTTGTVRCNFYWILFVWS